MKKFAAILIMVLLILSTCLVSGCSEEPENKSEKYLDTYEPLSFLTDEELQEKIVACGDSANEVDSRGLRHYYMQVIIVYQNELILRKLEK